MAGGDEENEADGDLRFIRTDLAFAFLQWVTPSFFTKTCSFRKRKAAPALPWRPESYALDRAPFLTDRS